MSVTANLAESLRMIVARLKIAHAEGNTTALALLPHAELALQEYDTGHAPTRPRGTFTPKVLGQVYGLCQNIVELTQLAGHYGYQPANSVEAQDTIIQWATEWEAVFYAKVESGEWHEDEWIERTEDFGREKLATVKDDCTNWRD